MDDDEIMSPGMLGKFDEMMKDYLARLGLSEGKDDIISQCGSARLRIYKAGDFVDKKTGEKISFEEGIELRQGAMKLHLEASDLAQLIYHCQNDQVVKKALNERLEKEKKMMKELGF